MSTTSRAPLRQTISQHLEVLVTDIGARPPGSPANHRATEYLAERLTAAGLEVREHPFTTRWWEPGVTTVDGSTFGPVDLVANPFTVTADVTGTTVRFDSLVEVESADDDLTDAVVILGPRLGGDMVMPKSFPFLQIDEQRALVAALERRRPAAVVAASSRYQSIPTFEDAELDFPSITVSPEMAAALATQERVRVAFRGRVHDGRGVTVSARTPGVGGARRRVIVSAHVDAKITTPGAFDNAASVAVVLALAEGWDSAAGDQPTPVEFVFFNGEDHYDACGEQAWLARNDLADVCGAINLDGAGVTGRRLGLTCMSCPAELERQLYAVGDERGWARMEPWYESDHAIFAMQGVPSVAITSEDVHDLLESVAHTAADTLDLVDVERLAQAVDGLRELVPLLG